MQSFKRVCIPKLSLCLLFVVHEASSFVLKPSFSAVRQSSISRIVCPQSCRNIQHKTLIARKKPSMLTQNDLRLPTKLLSLIACGILAFGTGSLPATSVDSVSPIIDEARSLGSLQKEKIAVELKTFEEKTGWKIRVLTRDSRRQEQKLSSQELRDLWKLPDENAAS